MPAIATPNQGMTAINKVILEIRKINSPASYKMLEEFIDLSGPVISQTLSASREIGLTQSAGIRGSYVLSELGKEYATYLSYNRAEPARDILQKSIMQNKKWNEIIEFLERQAGIPTDPYDLVLFVEKRIGKKWSRRMREQLRSSYVSILRTAGLVEMSGRKIVYVFKKQEISKTPRQKITLEEDLEGFAKLETEDFIFKIRKDLTVFEYAKNQFLSWLEYNKKRLEDAARN